jgi:hypothetical protein
VELYFYSPLRLHSLDKKTLTLRYLSTKSTVRSESRCALIKDFGSDVHERLYRLELA